MEKIQSEEFSQRVQKEVEQATGNQRNSFEQALGQIGLRYWEYDIKTKRLYRSALVQDEVGYDAYKENVPESYIEDKIIHPDYTQAYLDFYHNLQKGIDGRLVFQSRFADGNWGWLDISYKVLFDRSGIPYKAIGVGGNVTQRFEDAKKNEAALLLREKQLKEALAQAEKASNAKMEFLSRMSHDLRTPLNSVINMAALAVDDIGNEPVLKADLDKIAVAGEFMLGLINDILDMTKIENERLKLHPGICTHQEFVNYLEGVISPLCTSKDLEFVWDKTKAPPIPLWIDKIRFNQIFFNVLSNAVKYTDAGGRIEFREDNVMVEDGLLHCDYLIRDNGKGITKEFQERMFEPFERAAEAEAFVGTGLGLPITKKLVELMNGRIEVESEFGIGTTVKIHLELPVATEEQLLQSQQHNAEVTVTYNKTPRILVVEDHPLNREIVIRLLKKRDYEIEAACDGREAVDMIQSHGNGYYQAILMDIRMPVMDGITATRKIRALPQEDAGTIPIIAMTANAFDADKEKSRAAGMNAHLSKPVVPKLLYETLASYITVKE